MIILLHCSYINNLLDVDNIMTSLKSLFVIYQIFLDLFLQTNQIDTMDERASQSFNQLLTKELKGSSTSNVGFSGDWLDMNNCGGFESAIHSSIRLAKLLN